MECLQTGDSTHLGVKMSKLAVLLGTYQVGDVLTLYYIEEVVLNVKSIVKLLVVVQFTLFHKYIPNNFRGDGFQDDEALTQTAVMPLVALIMVLHQLLLWSK